MNNEWAEIKKKMIRHYAEKHNLRVFVETGTCHGATLEAMAPYFSELYSIELSLAFYKECRYRFRFNLNVHLYLGDSAVHLPILLKTTPDEPALYWLDAHCSGGDTAGDPVNPPLDKELEAIYNLRSQGVILIDDQHLTPDEVVKWQSKYPDFYNENAVTVLDISKGMN